MRVVTLAEGIRNVAKKFRGQYERCGKDFELHLNCGPIKAIDIQAVLDDLPVTATAEDVLKILPDPGWIYPKCCECNAFVERVVVFGSEDGKSESESQLCLKCLMEAVLLYDYRMDGLAKLAVVGLWAIGAWIITIGLAVVVGVPLGIWWVWHHVSIH